MSQNENRQLEAFALQSPVLVRLSPSLKLQQQLVVKCAAIIRLPEMRKIEVRLLFVSICSLFDEIFQLIQNMLPDCFLGGVLCENGKDSGDVQCASNAYDILVFV